MQIDRYNHLQFPRDTTSGASARESSSAAALAAAPTLSKPPAPVDTPDPAVVPPEGVVLKIQWPDRASAEAARANAVVYSDTRKAVPKQPDFVALAVSAMREFSDEAERQKGQSFDVNAAAPEMPWTRLKGLQQLAAKFNVFA